MIVAADENWCIGNKGKLLDSFPADMRFFRSITANKCVVMGDNTQRSLPNMYLKNRLNIVLCKDDKNAKQNIIKPEDKLTTNICYVPNIPSIPSAIYLFNHFQNETKKYPNLGYIPDTDVFIIGGGQVYKQFLINDLIDTIYLTKIHHKYDGDTFIPNLYELGFKEKEKLMPITLNDNGIGYEIICLKK
jgi:dihydrofolate reductase